MTDGDYLYDLLRELGASELLARTGHVVLSILLVLLGGLVAARIGSRLARRSVGALVARSSLPGMSPARQGRAAALAGVAASLVRFVVWFVATLMILGQLEVNLGPLLAGASVVGVALGFGAQTLVRDWLAGFFALAEDQYGVGDLITAAGVTGAVEEVTLRTTRLRSTDGTVWFIPNGEIRKLGNAAKDWARAIVDILVPLGADLTLATEAIAEEVEAFKDDPEWSGRVLEAPEVLGVEAMSPDGTTVRVAAKTAPEERARVARELRARLGARLVRDGVIQVQDTPPSRPPDVGPARDPSQAGGK